MYNNNFPSFLIPLKPMCCCVINLPRAWMCYLQLFAHVQICAGVLIRFLDMFYSLTTENCGALFQFKSKAQHFQIKHFCFWHVFVKDELLYIHVFFLWNEFLLKVIDDLCQYFPFLEVIIILHICTCGMLTSHYQKQILGILWKMK